jgi:hypothetical protein
MQMAKSLDPSDKKKNRTGRRKALCESQDKGYIQARKG